MAQQQRICPQFCLQEPQETWVWSLTQEGPLKEGIATHSSILACRIQWTEKPGRHSPWGHRESGTTESDLAHGHTLIDMKVGLSWTGSKSAGWVEQEVSNCTPRPHSIYFLPCHHKMSELQRAVRYLSLYLLILQNRNTKTQTGKPFCLNDRVWIKIQHPWIPGLSSRPLPGVVHEPAATAASGAD